MAGQQQFAQDYVATVAAQAWLAPLGDIGGAADELVRAMPIEVTS